MRAYSGLRSSGREGMTRADNGVGESSVSFDASALSSTRVLTSPFGPRLDIRGVPILPDAFAEDNTVSVDNESASVRSLHQ
jgi:hypothetical protein